MSMFGGVHPCCRAVRRINPPFFEFYDIVCIDRGDRYEDCG